MPLGQLGVVVMVAAVAQPEQSLNPVVESDAHGGWASAVSPGRTETSRPCVPPYQPER